MSKLTLYKLSAMTLAAYCLSCSTAFAATNYNGNENGKSKVPTDQMTIFDKEDEERVYDNHGFTRGDMNVLYNQEFDASAVESMSGEVEEVIRVQYPDKDCYLIAIISTSNGKGKAALNLGPTWFLEEKDITVNEGDEIQVKGAKVRTNGRHMIIVTELTTDGDTLNIRDQQGSPLWGTPKAQNGNAECMKNGKKNGRRNNSSNSSNSSYSTY